MQQWKKYRKISRDADIDVLPGPKNRDSKRHLLELLAYLETDTFFIQRRQAVLGQSEENAAFWT